MSRYHPCRSKGAAGPTRQAIARVFSGPAAQAGAEVTPSRPVGAEGSPKALLDAAASAVTRASEELRRLSELLQRLREAGGR
jgi:hypothetical protein